MTNDVKKAVSKLMTKLVNDSDSLKEFKDNPLKFVTNYLGSGTSQSTIQEVISEVKDALSKYENNGFGDIVNKFADVIGENADSDDEKKNDGSINVDLNTLAKGAKSLGGLFKKK